MKNPPEMSEERKFPPSFQYFVYTTLLIHVFLLAKPYRGRLNQAAFAPVVWAGRHSFELYLVQGAVCSLPFYFVHRLGTVNPLELFAWIYLFNVAISFGLAWGTVFALTAVRIGFVALRRWIARASVELWRRA